jgi:ABC-type sugar transport system permease subunit/ABC-type glycerol-3-phosphate transport system substrate-binding protein
MIGRALLLVCVAGLAWAVPDRAAAEQEPAFDIKVEWYAANGRHDISLVCFEVMRQDPTVRCVEFAPLRVDGGMGYTSGKVMAFATGAGPDVFQMDTGQIASFVEQGFLLPLNEFVGYDGMFSDGSAKLKSDGTPDRNGQIDDDEATWPHWKTLEPLARKIVTVDGQVYSIPSRRQDAIGLVYRRDLFRRAGVSEQPPRDWADLYDRLQRVMLWRDEQAPARQGIYIHRLHIYLYPWLWAAGARMVEEGKTHPDTGVTHWFAKEELAYIDPQTGDSLALQPSQWRVNITDRATLDAFAFLSSLFERPWAVDRQSGAPVNLTDQEVAAGQVRLADGRTLTFAPQDVRRGVARTYSGSDQASQHELFARGEVCVMQGSVGSDDDTLAYGVSPDQLGFWPMPPMHSEEPPVIFVSQHWLGFSPALAGESNRPRRLKAWAIGSSLGGELGQRMYVRYAVEQGRAAFLQPQQLRHAGFDAYVGEVPEHWQRDYQWLSRGRRYEPYNANWLTVVRNEIAPIFDEVVRTRGYDYGAALATAQQRANSYLLASRPAQEMAGYRRIALGVTVAAGALLLLALGLFIRGVLQKIAGSATPAGRSGSVFPLWLPWLLLLPALASIALWAYYPLLRGAAMAFMDYRLLGPRRWVGLDNFINVVLDDQFRRSVVATFQYVGVAMSLTFFTPIILAILLHEMPWFKTTLRTAFFLPQVSSGVVIMLFWKQVFDSSERGLLNKLVMAGADRLGLPAAPVDWLGHPWWAPVCVVLPQMWAGAGVASLVYLAALKTVPDDLYEAADLDGAGMWTKLRCITLPVLGPLILINFVGAFIGTFQQMQNIFVMTGGRGGTRVLAMHIWFSAYADLKFGPATACAWILASALIGFAVMQMRMLARLEFRQAKAE